MVLYFLRKTYKLCFIFFNIAGMCMAVVIPHLRNVLEKNSSASFAELHKRQRSLVSPVFLFFLILSGIQIQEAESSLLIS